MFNDSLVSFQTLALPWYQLLVYLLTAAWTCKLYKLHICGTYISCCIGVARGSKDTQREDGAKKQLAGRVLRVLRVVVYFARELLFFTEIRDFPQSTLYLKAVIFLILSSPVNKFSHSLHVTYCRGKKTAFSAMCLLQGNLEPSLLEVEEVAMIIGGRADQKVTMTKWCLDRSCS